MQKKRQYQHLRLFFATSTQHHYTHCGCMLLRVQRLTHLRSLPRLSSANTNRLVPLAFTSSLFHTSVKMASDAPYKVVTTKDAPSAIGPYSQAVVHNGLIFCSGCIPFVPSTMQLVEGDIQAQAQQSLDNLLAIVQASGSDKSHILKTTVFLKDMNDFAKVSFST